HVVDGRALGCDVQRHRGELRGRAAGQEQHLVIVGHAEKPTQTPLCLGRALDEIRATVADLDHGHTAALPIEQLFLRPAQHRLGQHRGAGAEVIHSPHRLPILFPARTPASCRAYPSFGSPPPLDGSLPPFAELPDPLFSSCTRSTPTSRSPSSRRIKRTPCVLRPSSEISATGVRTRVPFDVISMISSSIETCSAPTTRPLRSDVRIEMTP